MKKQAQNCVKRVRTAKPPVNAILKKVLTSCVKHCHVLSPGVVTLLLTSKGYNHETMRGVIRRSACHGQCNGR